MKGYLTIFLSLSLSLLTGFLLLLIGNAINNGWKIRLEGIADIGMNSVLGEYEIALHDRYGVFYVDASYLQKPASLQNIEERLSFYILQNLKQEEGRGVWGNTELKDLRIEEAVAASAECGKSLKRQAVGYVKDCGMTGRDILSNIHSADRQESFLAEEEWKKLMGVLAEMELPKRLNSEGIWEEVPLENPANRIFSLLGSDVLYLTGVDVNRVGTAIIQKKDYISGRQNKTDRKEDKGKIQEVSTDQFLLYLNEMMGNYMQVRPNSLLRFQLEYIAMGESSDYENLKAVMEQLIHWRFAVNASYALENSKLSEQASEVTGQITAVQLNPAFGEPVKKSILYACAYLETLWEIRCLLAGGRIAPEKGAFLTQIEQVLTGEIGEGVSGGSGISYREYVLAMINLLSEKERNMRTMDIMEMDIRRITGNVHFAMDYCIERFKVQINAKGSGGNNYRLSRTYGYF